jgi:hypothetical protein
VQAVVKGWLLAESKSGRYHDADSLSATLVEEVTANMMAATHPTSLTNHPKRKMKESLHPHFHVYVAVPLCFSTLLHRACCR